MTATKISPTQANNLQQEYREAQNELLESYRKKQKLASKPATCKQEQKIKEEKLRMVDVQNAPKTNDQALLDVEANESNNVKKVAEGEKAAEIEV